MLKYVLGLMLLPLTVLAQIPSYYQSVNLNSEGNILKNELYQLISSTHHHDLLYTPEVWNTLKYADVNPEDETQVLLIYGWNDTDNNAYNDRTRNRWATCHTSNCEGKWVREHVFPRSKGTPNLMFEGPGSDAHHLHAIDYERNGLRSNFKFAENNTQENGFSKVVMIGGVNYFYPGDEWKGDVARMVMYMYVRYGLQCQPKNTGWAETTYAPFQDMPDLFLKWNAEDPVSEHEVRRNEAIFEAQGNRNPFIDNPNLATKIWKGPNAENKWNAANEVSFQKNSMYLYPTITSSVFTIEGVEETILHESSLVIYDMLGKQVLFSERAQKENDISHLANGTYIVQVRQKNEVQTFRIIKK